MNLDKLREEGVYDPVGTIRACQRFGSIAFYIKVAQNCWRTVYVDPRLSQHLIPEGSYGDNLAGMHPVVFVPKPVE